MSKTPRSKKSPPSFQMYPLAEQIRRAMPVARQLLTEGINYGEREESTTGDRVQQIVNDPKLDAVLSGEEDAASRLENWLEAAMALGIGVGLMLRSETFLATDGAQ
jgi:hypothetical protein